MQNPPQNIGTNKRAVSFLLVLRRKVLGYSIRSKRHPKLTKKRRNNNLGVEIIKDERKNAICSISKSGKWTKEEENWRKGKGDLGKVYCLSGNSVLFLSQVGLSPIAIKLNPRNEHAAQGLNESHKYA